MCRRTLVRGYQWYINFSTSTVVHQLLDFLSFLKLQPLGRIVCILETSPRIKPVDSKDVPVRARMIVVALRWQGSVFQSSKGEFE